MPLSSIQLCHMDRDDRSTGKFTVTVHSDDGNQFATFECDSEQAARDLRNAIRDHATQLRRCADYRPKGAR